MFSFGNKMLDFSFRGFMERGNAFWHSQIERGSCFSSSETKGPGQKWQWNIMTTFKERKIPMPNFHMVFFHMDVSENSVTPKSTILIGCSIINHPFWGTPIFGNTHILSLFNDPMFACFTQRRQEDGRCWPLKTQLHVRWCLRLLENLSLY